MVDLNFTEFFYSQRPKELAEYRRLKGKKTLELMDADSSPAPDVEEPVGKLLGEVQRKSLWKFGKRKRKRGKRKPKRRR